MARRFGLTYDYLCPFARIVNEIVVDAIETGVPWEVDFHPFSLAQSHVEEGDTPVWDRPADSEGTYGVQALYWSLAVQQEAPERFLAFHRTLYSVRHDDGADINDVEVLEAVARASEIDPELIAEVVATGQPAKVLAARHTEAAERWGVFGVPTFLVDDEAVFVRLMERGRIDDVERVLDAISWTRLNEFKRTRIPR